MSKLMVQKEAFKQITSKLNNAENKGNNGKLEENSSISDESSKLPANKNIFQRGDFDEFKISDEELLEHQKEIEKSSKERFKNHLVHIHDSLGRDYFRETKYLDVAEQEKLSKQKADNPIQLQRLELANTSPLIKGIQPLPITRKNWSTLANNEYQKIQNEINKGLRCNATGQKVVKLNKYHDSHKHGKLRNYNDLINHVGYLPFVIKVLKDGKYDKKMDRIDAKTKSISHEIVSRAEITENGKRKRIGISVVVYETKNVLEVERVSVFRLEDKYGIIKSTHIAEASENGLHLMDFSNSKCLNSILTNSQNKSSSTLKNVQKSLTYSGHKLQGRTKLYGMDISIENKKGSYRSGVDSDGHKWRCYMNYDYGYIRGTEGVDGDHVDCYLGPDKEAEKVYVIHQNNPITHKYDEDKCMLCFATAADAKKAYMKQYDRPGFYGSMDILTIDQFKSYVFSNLGKKIHKSFDIVVTDITEGNKFQKIQQVQKSLEAIANNKQFVIKHIPADNTTKFEPVTLRITNFDKSKIEKAVHKMAFSLDTDIPASGEAFNFKSQEELTNRIVKEFTQKTNLIYSFVIDYFDLPEIRIVSKSKLRYKGKVIYNPETGKPISKKEWKKFVAALEEFLNRNYGGMGERIVLGSESLGRILQRMSENNSMESLKKMKLDDLEVNHRKFDWISNTASNMTTTFGESVTRDRAARIQSAIDSAAQRITRVSDNMRNDIQQIIIDGVKDRKSKSQISQSLFDKCVGLNRDFQKIADTEIQNNTNNAYLKEEVYHTKEGEKVYFKRFEIIDDNTCKRCKAIKGVVALWSDVPLPDEHIDDPYADYAIWEYKMAGDLPVSVMHPYCYSDDTEVMTNNGWKLFKDVLDDDLIMSINPETYEIDFVPFINRIQYQYNGEMIHFPGRNFDMLVTPNHNMLIEERKSGKWHGVKAEDLIDKTIYQIPRARGLWNGSNSEKIKIGCVEYSYIQYIKLWAWYLSEGSGRKRSDNAYEIKLAQKNINKILDDIPEFSERFVKGKEALYCTGKIAEMFEQMFGVYAADKYIPDFIKNSSAECIRAFLYSFNLGDGSKRNRENIKNNSLGIKKSNDFVVRTSSKKMADDLCELIIKAGWMPSIHVTKQKGKEVMFRNGTYKLNTDCYVINICKSKNKVYSKHVYPGHPESHLPYKLNYSGMVYDVELEKWHFLLVKRNGKCGWSGNCRGSWFRYYPEFD